MTVARTRIFSESAGASYARGEPILRMTGVDGQHASAGFALPQTLGEPPLSGGQDLYRR